MKDLFYDQSGLVIAAVLLALMAISIEAGFRIGARAQSSTSESLISQVKAMQASLLGLLALLLGFTFSIASDLFNTRSNTVVDEANAIRTVYRRTELLPESSRGEVRAALRKYVSSRAQESELASTEHSKRDAMLKESVGLQAALWTHAVQAYRQDPNAGRLFVQSLNDLIDTYGRRVARLDRHVPKFVLLLLYGSFIVTGGIIGYVAGVSGHRPAGATYIMASLVVLLMFMVIDLDHPRTGFILVSHQPLTQLNSALNGE